jgi:hypothetical protein
VGHRGQAAGTARFGADLEVARHGEDACRGRSARETLRYGASARLQRRRGPGAAGDRALPGFRTVKFEETPGDFSHGTVRDDIRVAEFARRIDSLDAYRRLADSTSIPIAAGDWGFTTRFEFADLMDRGGVDVVQPSTLRSGGISKIPKIAEMAYRRGLLTVPHCWNHIVGVAAAAHIAAVTPNTPYFEYPVAFPPSPLVSGLLLPALEPEPDGWITVPRRPGLGFTLDEDVVKRYRVPPR